MATQTGKDTARESQDELAALGFRTRGSLLSVVITALIGLGLVVIIVFSINQYSGKTNSLRLAKEGIVSPATAIGEDFVDTQIWYSEWIATFGGASEQRLFDRFSEILYSQVASASLSGSGSIFDFLRRAYVSLLFGMLRIGFVLLACWKVWLVVTAAAMFWGIRSVRVYSGPDFLGMLGNGRLFYSGIKGKITSMTPEGAPDTHVRGLACPATVSIALADASALAKILDRYGARNNTTLELVGIIIKNGQMPAYVARHGEAPVLDQAFSGGNLSDAAERIVDRALSLHEMYIRGAVGDGEFTFPPVESAGKRGGLDQYSLLLQRSLHRVLTPRMRRDLSKLSAAELATVILAHEAGKVLVSANEAGRWIRKSNFGQLCARAVLHSLPSYGKDFSYRARGDIRRSIVYGSRRSIYAPIRFPVDLSDTTRAARQWVEVLMACPHELAQVTDDVELFGLFCEAHDAWKQAFFDGVTVMNPEVTDGVFAVDQKLFFMPARSIVSILRRALGPETIRRLEELELAVYQQQRLGDLSAEGGADTTDKGLLSVYDRLERPPSPAEMKALAEQHSLPFEDVREWSALHAMLRSFGWMAQRVGENSVPDSSIVHLAIKVEAPVAGKNALGLIGRSGMVPLRGTELEVKWGKGWTSRFMLGSRAEIAEDKGGLEKLLAGFEEARPFQDESDEAAIV